MNLFSLKSEHRDFLSRVTLWFHRREVPYALALIRIAVPLILLIGAIPRWFHARELYSADGSPAPFWESYGHVDLLPIFPAEVAIALQTALIFFLISASLGWKTRFCLLAAAVLSTYFGIIDGISTMTKYTVIGAHTMLLLSVSGCGEVWSVDQWLSGEKPKRHAVWPQRLIQLLIGITYLGAAATKLHTSNHFTGDHMSFWMLTNVNHPNPLGEYLTLFPAILVVLAYVTVVWETLFLWLVWKGWGRFFMLGIGIVFHVLTYLTLGLIVFPLLYLSLYLSYLSNGEAKRIGTWLFGNPFRWVKSFEMGNSTGWGRTPAFAGCVATFMLLGITAEAQRDPYRQADGAKYELRPLSSERAAELLRNDVRITSADKLFAYDVGTTTINGILANRRTNFQRGETAVIEARLIVPHEDMWVGVDVVDSDGRLIQQLGNIAGREHARILVNWTIPLGLQPGDFQIVFRIDQQEVGRRTFRVH
ncbi:MAG: HTTM domain-containing protein [Planctomycetaceae bacterium]|nr:HTTM domain-containing protein [Planctomycetaceae bacterium]